MSVISPGVRSRSRFFHSPILFRESNPAAVIASLFAKGKIKNGVPHILESHPRERRARMGHSLHGSTTQKPKREGWATRPLFPGESLLKYRLSWAVSLAAAISFSPAHSDAQSYSRFEVGMQTTMLREAGDTSGCGGCETAHWTTGPEITINLNQYFALNGTANFFPGYTERSSDTFGGHLTQVLAGVKASIRSKRFTLFIKARPGFLSWDHTVTGVQFLNGPGVSTPFIFSFGRKTFFAVNIAGGGEYMLSRKVGISVEMGDSIVRYTNNTGIGSFKNDFQFSTGLYYHCCELKAIERKAGSSHKFLDKTNIGLLAAGLLAHTADAITTQHSQARCRRTNPSPDSPFSGCASQEGNFLARPFVTHGWGGQIAFTGIVYSAEIALMYGIHRMGFHKIERTVPIAQALANSLGAYHNVN